MRRGRGRRGKETLIKTGADTGAGFRPDIEGLRGLAVLLVVIFHAGLPLPGGFIGVDVFFVISGFLITGLLLREREQTGRIDLVAFYARRVRRLLPAALVVLLVTLPVAYALFAPLDRGQMVWDGAAAALSVGNIRFALAEGDYFANLAAPSPFLHFWSLAVEEQFYLVWPALLLLAAVAWRRRPRRAVWIALFDVFLASLVAAVAAHGQRTQLGLLLAAHACLRAGGRRPAGAGGADHRQAAARNSRACRLAGRGGGRRGRLHLRRRHGLPGRRCPGPHAGRRCDHRGRCARWTAGLAGRAH